MCNECYVNVISENNANHRDRKVEFIWFDFCFAVNKFSQEI